MNPSPEDRILSTEDHNFLREWLCEAKDALIPHLKSWATRVSPAMLIVLLSILSILMALIFTRSWR
jgi:hypothetical protein